MILLGLTVLKLHCLTWYWILLKERSISGRLGNSCNFCCIYFFTILLGFMSSFIQLSSQLWLPLNVIRRGAKYEDLWDRFIIDGKFFSISLIIYWEEFNLLKYWTIFLTHKHLLFSIEWIPVTKHEMSVAVKNPFITY